MDILFHVISIYDVMARFRYSISDQTIKSRRTGKKFNESPIVIDLIKYLSTNVENISQLESDMLELKELGDAICVAKITASEVLTLDVPELKEKLQQAIVNKGIKKLVLDLSDVKIITSSGIGIFLNINQSLKSLLRLAAPQPEVEKVLELTKVSSVIKVFSTVDAALKSF
jgi:anti-anti-sigma factor